MEKTTINNAVINEGFLEREDVFKTSLNLKAPFVKASQHYLELIRDMREDINKWEAAAVKLKEKDPNSFQIKRYLREAQKIKFQVDYLLKYYLIVEKIINRLENEIWVKERTESLLFLQLAANKQKRDLDILSTVFAIYGNKSRKEA